MDASAGYAGADVRALLSCCSHGDGGGELLPLIRIAVLPIDIPYVKTVA